MAIIPSAEYPGKIDTSDPVGYPQGKAQNITTPGDGTGTPWEKSIVNDFLGFQQALLAEAQATPTGTPDKVGASQYLDAIPFASGKFPNLNALLSKIVTVADVDKFVTVGERVSGTGFGGATFLG